MAEGASTFWKFAASTVHSFLPGAASVPLSEVSESNLADLSERLETPFSEQNDTHVDILRQLWAVQFPDRASQFARPSVVWKDAGWQGTDPVGDLKSSGLLALQSLIFFGNKYADVSARMLAQNRANLKTNYPYAVVGINLTLLLADLLNLKDNK